MKKYNTRSSSNLIQNGTNYRGYLSERTRRELSLIVTNFLYAAGYEEEEKEKTAQNNPLTQTPPQSPHTKAQQGGVFVSGNVLRKKRNPKK